MDMKDCIRFEMEYSKILGEFKEYLEKYKIGRVVKRSITQCLYVFNDDDEKLEYNETVKKLNELDKKITNCKYLLNGGGLRIIRNKNYQNFRNVILEIAKAISK